MDLTKILKRESNNVDYIYLYADLEKDWFIAYEFSAYVLTQLFDILELEEEFEPETGTNIYFTRLPDQFILEHTLDRRRVYKSETHRHKPLLRVAS